MRRNALLVVATVGFLATGACSAKSPSDQDRLMKHGMDALYNLHDPQSAVADFQKVLQINPSHYGATFQVARALDETGRKSEAVAYWTKMLFLAQNTRDEATLAIVRERLAGQTSNPQDSIMHQGMDALYLRRDPGAAIAFFHEVLRLNPAHYGATYQLACALDLAGKTSEARPYWEKALAMAQGYRDEATIALIRPHLSRSR